MYPLPLFVVLQEVKLLRRWEDLFAHIQLCKTGLEPEKRNLAPVEAKVFLDIPILSNSLTTGSIAISGTAITQRIGRPEPGDAVLVTEAKAMT